MAKNVQKNVDSKLFKFFKQLPIKGEKAMRYYGSTFFCEEGDWLEVEISEDRGDIIGWPITLKIKGESEFGYGTITFFIKSRKILSNLIQSINQSYNEHSFLSEEAKDE